ncbi:MAG: hypothetical protein BJ554DRAFT_1406 [Olpidium bornovanus]|uniref:Uncharacterized protein n=1 Tax=Olpidium bornovanus TaxID=278681 RepID=A0A8H7ZSS3_9FUNG|nr:MAG: hypothetical protein BJ554DRAFT_1406 [Olpidium bornovanus]
MPLSCSKRPRYLSQPRLFSPVRFDSCARNRRRGGCLSRYPRCCFLECPRYIHALILLVDTRPLFAPNMPAHAKHQ